MENLLFYGDNLDVLRRHIPDESVDLVYLDPPFNSNATYNVLFAERDGSRAAAQIEAFDDTWHWDRAAAEAYQELVERGGRPADALRAFRQLLGDNDMMAYLSMMAPRLVELRRVLKPTGSLYLHCDPTASHYLKVLMDAIFGPTFFKNEITWKRSSAHNDPRRYGAIADIILFYTKGEDYTWNVTYQEHGDRYIKSHYIYEDEHGIFRAGDLTGAGQGPPRVFGERGEIAPPKGRHWMYDQAGIDRLMAEGRIYWPKKGLPALKKYLDDSPGVPSQCIWTDIPPVNAVAKERLGYPTQKPEALLERIIKASSNEGDVVLDPFCGCGTTIVVAERLHRNWIGIDITHVAVQLMKKRLQDTFGEAARYEVRGEPTTVEDAAELARTDPHQFEWWAVHQLGGAPSQKKGADRGIDGRLYFHDGTPGGKTRQVILSVKAGHVSVAHIRELSDVVRREEAEIGALITMQPPTQPMRAEAAGADFFTDEVTGTRYPRIQILTVAELMEGKTIERPYASQPTATFKRAPRAQRQGPRQEKMDLEE